MCPVLKIILMTLFAAVYFVLLKILVASPTTGVQLNAMEMSHYRM